jgi:hypothetical protein
LAVTGEIPAKGNKIMLHVQNVKDLGHDFKGQKITLLLYYFCHNQPCRVLSYIMHVNEIILRVVEELDVSFTRFFTALLSY